MFDKILRKVFGTRHERELKRIQPKVDAINALEAEYKAMSDDALRAKTAEFKTKLENGASLDDILVPAFATCREGGFRALGMRHYDVQLFGGVVLHEGKIAEMKTGEGKTLVATLACYLNALEGKGVHVVTVNDYLARRDSEWMGKLYGYLGLSTGCVVHSQRDNDKKRAYRCDITYGQNNEFGFDYLRDNMKFSIYDYAQRELNYAIVDEVDSILVDEARTPLIISGPGESASDKYIQINELVPRLRKDEHYALDEKHHSVALTEDGIERIQKLLLDRGVTKSENLFDPANLETLHIVNQMLRAHTLYKRDQHYMVTPDGKILIIDEFTGRALPGRRWSDGLHQSVEAKEQVPIQDENRTLATISFQNLFRLYKKLSGMTGTADTEAAEFHKTYKLDVNVIPTHRDIKRVDSHDLIYKTEREKFKAVLDEITECHERGQPVLVGTASVEKSDAIHRILTKANIPHNVLNAKQHEREAYVVAQAGRKGSVTVATNMAGRGTDILLGGNPEMLARMDVSQKPELFMVPAPMSGAMTDGQQIPMVQDPVLFEKAIEDATARLKIECEKEKQEVLSFGGLHILGTERHESRRIDNQLRGRAGRQGDPGTSRFFLSLEDDLMRIFAGEKIQGLMDRLGMEEGVPIEHPWVTKSVENAQKKVEERNFDIRKNLLEYDDVMNQQRKSIYSLRRQILEGQYRNVPSEEEQKKGAQPTRIVTTADEQFTKSLEPVIRQMVQLMGAPPPPVGSTLEQMNSAREAALATPIEQIKTVATEPLEQVIYREFGARLDLRKFANKPVECFEYLMDEVPMSLTEQHERLFHLMEEKIGIFVDEACPRGKHFEEWDRQGLARRFQAMFGIPADGIATLPETTAIAERLFIDAEAALAKREKEHGIYMLLRIFRDFYLREIDRQWIEHLQAMEQLRDGIGLRGYGQKDPKKEYQREGHTLFMEMVDTVKSVVVDNMFHFELQREEDVARMEEERARQLEAQLKRAKTVHVEAPAAGGDVDDAPNSPEVNDNAGAQQARNAAPRGPQQVAPQPIETVRREKPKVGRNDPCWCGSGKKYKSCHMREDEGAGAR